MSLAEQAQKAVMAAIKADRESRTDGRIDALQGQIDFLAAQIASLLNPLISVTHPEEVPPETRPVLVTPKYIDTHSLIARLGKRRAA